MPKKRKAISTKELVERLKSVAHVGQLFIDGDACEEALRPAARAWTSGDDIDYDFEVAVPIKQTLLRLEEVEDFPYQAVLWRRRPDDPKKVEVLLAGRMGSPYGRGPIPLPAPLKSALVQGKVAVASMSAPAYEHSLGERYGHVWVVDHDSFLRSGHASVISVFAPIRNSDDELVAALELSCVGRDG